MQIIIFPLVVVFFRNFPLKKNQNEKRKKTEGNVYKKSRNKMNGKRNTELLKTSLAAQECVATMRTCSRYNTN